MYFGFCTHTKKTKLNELVNVNPARNEGVAWERGGDLTRVKKIQKVGEHFSGLIDVHPHICDVPATIICYKVSASTMISIIPGPVVQRVDNTKPDGQIAIQGINVDKTNYATQ